MESDKCSKEFQNLYILVPRKMTDVILIVAALVDVNSYAGASLRLAFRAIFQSLKARTRVVIFTKKKGH